ncbi:MerR family transcriptional regulator [Pseudoxanthomonas winnipegensis]|uniref:MerR family transcriptional regulator n=1 Tax=Pseudoxanthomonas winnipegensis TaxID=2480810 RepID=A0A4Q8LYS5_9GAMM|nr:helix-turn-helix domain-containing protein [Pseudoxanthomonas winnipegensis]TAA37632.1 MerR family transcriptional regulator [Pseudoxanthomonas winnipegensis]
MKISEAAESSGCHLETIRYYERVGLMPRPHRTASGYREYRDEEVDRLRFITRSRNLGFSLDEIRSLLRLEHNRMLSCAEIDAIAREHLADVRSKVRELNRIARELDRTINACSGGARGQCSILATLREPPPAKRTEKAANVRRTRQA